MSTLHSLSLRDVVVSITPSRYQNIGAAHENPQIIHLGRLRALPYDQISNEARARREQSLLCLLYKDGRSLTVNRENLLFGCLPVAINL